MQGKRRLTKTQLTMLAAGIGIAANIVLACVKLGVALMTNTLCIYSDSINNFLDALSCAIAFTGFYLLLNQRNEKYPFGYGRAEYIISFLVALITVGVGITFAVSAIERLVFPDPISFAWKYFILLLVTVPVKLALALFFRAVHRKSGSMVLRALALDGFMDCGITSMVVISFALAGKVDLVVDAIFGIIVSIYILICGVKLIGETLDGLMGANYNKKYAPIIEHVLLEVSGITAVSSIDLHNYGSEVFYAAIIVEIIPCPIEAAAELCRTAKEKLEEETGIKSVIEISLPTITKQ